MYAEFNEDGTTVTIQCQESDIIGDIFKKYLHKIEKVEEPNEATLISNGVVVNISFPLSAIINSIDRERKKVSILVLYNGLKLIEHSNIICPECLNEADLKFHDYKIKLKCEKGHLINNLLVNEFQKSQEIEPTRIICDICKVKNIGNCKKGTFYSCLNCNENMCEECKNVHLKEHEKKHKKYIIKYNIEKYVCNNHNKNFISYCENCKIDLCEDCVREHLKINKFDDIKPYQKILPDHSEMLKKKESLKKAQTSVNKYIKSLIDNLNEIKGNLDSFIGVFFQILNKYKPDKVNYKMINNIKSINFDKVIKDLNEININDNLINKFHNTMNLYYKMKYASELTLIYKINKNAEKIKILGDEFVKNNFGKCKLVVKDQELDLRSSLHINKHFNKEESKVIVILKNINDIKNMKGVFSDSSLQYAPDLSKLYTGNIEIMDEFFKNCRCLEKLPELDWDVKNVKTMKNMFSGCRNMKYLSFKNFNTENNEDLSYMFYDDSSLQYIKGLNKFEVSKVKTMEGMFSDCKKLAKIDDISCWKTPNLEKMGEMFKGCKSLKVIPDISGWDTKNVKDIHQIFHGCENLNSLPDISKWKTNNFTQINGAFCGCCSIKSLPDISKWDTFNITSFCKLFADCSKLLELPDISCWNTINVNNFSKLFYNCSSLRYLPNINKWNTCNVETMKQAFSGCHNLYEFPDISEWNTSKVKDMGGLFNECRETRVLPDISNWNTESVTNMKCLFNECSSLTSLPNIGYWNISRVKDISSMFCKCSSLRRFPDISKWDSSNICFMANLFSCCSNLEIIPDLSKWNMRKVLDMSWMFYECSSLQTVPDISKWNINESVNKFEMFKRNLILKELPDLGMDSINMRNMNFACTQFCMNMGMMNPFGGY